MIYYALDGYWIFIYLLVLFLLIGYYIRKYVYNYYSRKKYLEGVVTKNEIVR